MKLNTEDLVIKEYLPKCMFEVFLTLSHYYYEKKPTQTALVIRILECLYGVNEKRRKDREWRSPTCTLCFFSSNNVQIKPQITFIRH